MSSNKKITFINWFCSSGFLSLLFFQCSSGDSDQLNTSTFDSVYEGTKNDSLKIEISFDATKKLVTVCTSNISDRELFLADYRHMNVSYSAAPGFVLFAFEEAGDDYIEMTDNRDYQSVLKNGREYEKTFAQKESDCENDISPGSFFDFETGKKYKLLMRYYPIYEFDKTETFVESNVLNIVW